MNRIRISKQLIAWSEVSTRPQIAELLYPINYPPLRACVRSFEHDTGIVLDRDMFMPKCLDPLSITANADVVLVGEEQVGHDRELMIIQNKCAVSAEAKGDGGHGVLPGEYAAHEDNEGDRQERVQNMCRRNRPICVRLPSGCDRSN